MFPIDFYSMPKSFSGPNNKLITGQQVHNVNYHDLLKCCENN